MYSSIFTAYEKPYTAKVNAWYRCKDICAKYDGYNLQVRSKNTFIFTAQFDYIEKDTGTIKRCIIYPTRTEHFYL